MIVKVINVNGVDHVVWDSGTGVTSYEDADGLRIRAREAIVTLAEGLKTVQGFANGTLVTDAKINANPAQYMRLVAAETAEMEIALITLAKVVAGETLVTEGAAPETPQGPMP